MKEFIKAIMTPQDEALTCRACEEALTDYIDAQLTGVAPATQFAAVERHLQGCPSCADAYRELLELTALAYADELPALAALPKLDFVALERLAAGWPHKPYWWDEFGHMILRFSEELLAAWQPAHLAPAYSGVKAADAAQVLAQVAVGEAARDLTATVTVKAEEHEATECSLEVAVDVPSRGGWPNLDEIRVTLKREEELLAEALTDAFGVARFPKIARGDLPNLVIEIAPAEDR